MLLRIHFMFTILWKYRDLERGFFMQKLRMCISIVLCIFLLSGCNLNAEKIFKEEEESGIIRLSSLDLTNYDLSDYEEQLFHSNFDTLTKWPKDLPKRFDYQRLISLGKNPGMNVYKLHEEGITGKNIGIAIIDMPLLSNHNEYKDNLKYYYVHNGSQNMKAHYHGTAVASLAVGKDIGTAPGADLYFIGESHLTGISGSVNEIPNAIAEDIHHIIEINKNLKNKIRIISISKGFSFDSNYEIIQQAIQKANENNITVITADTFDEEWIGASTQRKIYADPDRAISYKPCHFLQNKHSKQLGISIPLESRTIASVLGVNEYEYCARGGVSWAIPYLAGVYALALQVKPDLTYQEFTEIAVETAEETNILKVISPYKIVHKLKDNNSK